MSKVKNQHYIPRSYLRGFAHQSGKEWFVFSEINGVSVGKINVRKICAKRYLYDVPELGEAQEQLIEKYYANHVDGNFPEILDFAKDEGNTNITEELRAKIISSCISLIFRTPKFLEEDANQIELHTDIEGEDDKEKRKRKVLALQNHLKNSIELIRQKHDDGIAINKAQEGMTFITSNNPIVMRNPDGEFRDYFDPTNIFHVPISPEYSITITPSKEEDLKNTCTRYSFNKASVLSVNHDIARASQQFLIGAENGIEEFHRDMKIYDNPTPEGLKMLRDQKKMSMIMKDVFSTVEKHGAASKETREIYMKYWEEEEVVREDENYTRHMKDLGLI